MSDDTAQETQPHWQFRAFQETPEHLAARLTAADPNATPGAPPDPIRVARQQLARAVREDGFVINLDSIVEVSRQAVIVSEEMDDHRPARDDETPSGHLVLWQCTGRERTGTDADDPVIDCTVQEAGRLVIAVVPDPYDKIGGAARLRHNLNGSVTVHARKADGEGMGYLFATTLDDNSVHVEFFAGTASFDVIRD